MTHREQTNYIETLKSYEKKMDLKEAEIFKMFLKRHKDDEDLDKLSSQKLIELYNKYYVNRVKKDPNQLFKSYQKEDNDL